MNTTISPTAALSRDHDVVLSQLLKLEQTATALGEGTASTESERELRDAVAFLQAEIPPHFAREELALFPPLAALGPKWTGLLAVILAEHQGLHDLRSSLVTSLDPANNHAEWGEVRRRADDLIIVLRRHINKEDSMIFPMAEQDLGSERLAAIAEQMHHLDK